MFEKGEFAAWRKEDERVRINITSSLYVICYPCWLSTQKEGARRHDAAVPMRKRPSNGKACHYKLLHDGSRTPETGPCNKLTELQTNSRHAKLPTARYRVADEAGSANAVFLVSEMLYNDGWLSRVLPPPCALLRVLLFSFALRGPAGAVMLLPSGWILGDMVFYPVRRFFL